MRTRPFLRTAEFLWQEGHTAHASKAEAIQEALQMHDVYTTFAEEYMAMPVIKGAKSENERFAGADDTFTIEAMMQDGKALQAGTSHYLGQNFAKAFNVKFLNTDNKEEFVYATSWGVSTRLIGALVMTHSDDDGLILPPKLAPIQVVIIPIPKPSEAIDNIAQKMLSELKSKGIKVIYDRDEKNRPGFKFAEYELKVVPVRIGIGARDIENGVVEIARRDTKHTFTKLQKDLLNLIQLNVKPEVDIKVNFDEARLSGKIDAVIINKEQGTATIRDYKTGTPKKSLDSRYKNQLYFYRLLLEISPQILPKNIKLKSAELAYISPKEDQLIIASLDYHSTKNESEYLEFKKLVKDVWSQIMSLGQS